MRDFYYNSSLTDRKQIHSAFPTEAELPALEKSNFSIGLLPTNNIRSEEPLSAKKGTVVSNWQASQKQQLDELKKRHRI
jgi:hypothetical protein